MSAVRPSDSPLPPHPKLKAAASSDGDLTVEEARRRQIDARIQALEQEIIDLKVERNDISPISRLPPEILSRVFVAYANSCPTPKTPTNFGTLPGLRQREENRSLEWTVVTEISRRWRDVALSCPQLWSRIAFHTAGWAELMLNRSKQAPLHIELPENLSPTKQIYAFKALSQPHRLKALKFNGDSVWVRKRVEELTSPAPILETLELCCYGYGAPGDMSLPENIFNGEAPTLRHLSLVGWKLKSWTSPLLNGLTTLKLHSQHNGADAIPPPATVFLDALERMPNLTELDLNTSLPDMATVMGPKVVAFPSMKRFTLSGSLKRVSGVLKHMSIAPSASLQLICTMKANEDASVFNEFVTALNSSWLSVPVPSSSSVSSTSTPIVTAPRSIKSLSIEMASYNGMRLSCYFAKANFRPGGKSKKPLHVEIHGDSKRATKELIKSLPLSDLRYLDLRSPISDTEMSQFARLPNVESVYLNEHAVRNFLNYINNDPVMRPPKSKGAHNRRKNLSYFRRLRFLSLDGANFSDEYETDSMTVDDFCTLLMLRYELGGTIEKLHLKECCSLYANDVKSIREVCPQVEWDGIEIDRDSEDEEGYGYHGHGCDCHMHWDDDEDFEDDYYEDFYEDMFSLGLF